MSKKKLLVRVGTCVLLLLTCFYMYDFYKCLSGFIANGFREPEVMLPMILAFFLPVLCFLGFFYDTYVRAMHPVVKTACAIFAAVYALADLGFIFAKWALYASNSELGVYDVLPGLLWRYPYGMVILLLAILLWQVLLLAVGNRKSTRTGAFLERIKQRGSVELSVLSYLALCVLAIVVFVFTGAAITATFTAFGNVFYDVRYLFLLVWVMLVPMGNLVMLALRPERMGKSKRARLITLGGGVGVNVAFGLLFLLCELTHPDFLVHIGKPLFFIAFSVSLPIEPAILLGIMALGTVIMACRFIAVARERDDRVKP